VRVAAVAAALVAACVVAGTARANGDPASDVLISERVFFPYAVKVLPATTRDLTRKVAEADRGGYAVRVALIGNRFDLGAVPVMWRRPQVYAKFLAQELAQFNTDWVLTVMPNGYGIYRCQAKERAGGYSDPCEGGVPAAADERALKALATPEQSRQDVVSAAGAAVDALASLHGSRTTGGGGGLAVVAVAGVALALLSVTAAALVALQRRARRTRGVGAGESRGEAGA
jgi:hypothetical protein